MRRFSSRAAGWRRIAVLAMAAGGVGACGASPVGGPDPARSTYFKATMIDGGALPYRFRLSPLDLAFTYFIEARLVPLDLGRTTDTRIFDDRGGTGSGGGNGRDTTVSTGRMSDIRTFSSAAEGGSVQTDSTVVDVVRVGDVLYITRPHPDPSRNVTDTAFYESGVLVRPLRYWRSVIELPTGRRVTYTTVR
ncbi:MAG: hypothetical protein IPP90_04695 [Gemmatimonadaceae bacterium]|nr:hypothetical protein [Gemmatimonadaceae bacterium]